VSLWDDRQYISQWSVDPIGLYLVQNQVPIDADGTVQVAMIAEDTGITVFARAATHNAVGDYSITLASTESGTPGPYLVTWDYQLGGLAQHYETGIEIGPANPAYDNLTPEMKAIVDSIWIRLSDLIDSPGGGPNLTTYVQQSKFGRGRIAQLMRIGLGRLNTMAQPHSTFTLDGLGGSSFPVAQWGPLLESVTWIEVLKHLIRSYTEQPDFVGGGNISRLDRTKYAKAWRDVMVDEEVLVKGQVDVFKVSQMNLGRPAVLISGGVYARYGPTRMAGSVAARPRYWTRFA
jgi:hypothetical protein